MLNLNDLYTSLKDLANIPQSEWQDFEKNWQTKKYAKADHLLKADEYEKGVHYITKGSVRLYYVTPEGKEFNQTFKFEGDLVSGYASLIMSQKSWYFIETMETTETFFLEYKVLLEFFGRHACWERLGRKIAEEHYIRKERREFAFLSLSAEQRYQQMLEERPKYMERVPQYHVASYLGITAPAFNRLLKGQK